MRELLREYYKGTDLINNINEIIDSMIEGFCLILPPVIPFIRDYYNALGIADDLIRKSV